MTRKLEIGIFKDPDLSLLRSDATLSALVDNLSRADQDASDTFAVAKLLAVMAHSESARVDRQDVVLERAAKLLVVWSLRALTVRELMGGIFTEPTPKDTRQ